MNRKKLLSALIPGTIILTAFLFLFINKDKKAVIAKSNHNQQPAYRCYPIMGTWAEISLYGNEKETAKALDIIQKIFTNVSEHCNRFDKKSELSKLNVSASEKPFKCSSLLWGVLLQSKYFHELSDGSFDITITPLMQLWGFYKKQDKIPRKQEIENTLLKVGLDKVVFNEKNHTVFFKEKGMTIDLGGIAKGYAVDIAFEAVQNMNINAGVINLGGNIRTFPNPPPGRKTYSVGVRDPFDKNKIMDGTVQVLGQSLATSGNYEQFVIINGERFTHIINPLTGYPIKDMAADTVICKSATWADALSTSVFLNGEKFAEKLHQLFPDIEILVVRGYKDKPSTIKIFKYGNIWSQIEEPLTEHQ